MRTVLIGITIALITSPALAQQDPDDPGIQDSVIFIAAVDHFDSSGEYQYCNVEEWAVTDDSVMFYNIPLRWHAPRGGVTCGTGTLWWPPYDCLDAHYDTVLLEQGYVRQLYWASSDSPYYCPVLFTDAERLHFKTLRFIISANAPSQLVVFDTCYDELNGSVLLGLIDRISEITPAIQPGFFSIGSVGVDDENQIAASFTLPQNYPNPFNASTTISYELPESGPVTLCIYNPLGQKVATLFEGVQQAGEHKAVWDAKGAPSGVYFYRITAGEYNQTRSMVVLR